MWTLCLFLCYRWAQYFRETGNGSLPYLVYFQTCVLHAYAASVTVSVFSSPLYILRRSLRPSSFRWVVDGSTFPPSGFQPCGIGAHNASATATTTEWDAPCIFIVVFVTVAIKTYLCDFAIYTSRWKTWEGRKTHFGRSWLHTAIPTSSLSLPPVLCLGK